MAIMTAGGRMRVRAAIPPDDPPIAIGPEAIELGEALLWDPERKLEALPRVLESLLFVADQPVSVADLARVVDLPRPAVERALAGLESDCLARGLRVQRSGGQVQLVTAPELAPFVQRFLGLEANSRLSKAALETLSIIAYRQPATRPEVDALRGVNSEASLRTLLGRGLVAPVGRRETVGQPVEYGTTFQFLEYFGITGLHELAPLAEAEARLEAEAGPAADDAGP
jgi:segregation and condensation protein B